jgi:hypothetical protein
MKKLGHAEWTENPFKVFLPFPSRTLSASGTGQRNNSENGARVVLAFLEMGRDPGQRGQREAMIGPRSGNQSSCKPETWMESRPVA